ncbi:hypothetical protein GC584_08355 [Corynebacterium sp. zg912]|uniref:Histone n=1 Tax=Corynebacterium wankanglinii TaxID=2735136 RepID=A0A7V9A2D5_9CORY|nr:hypothetical protein [Corynebacterium wankanglinii]MBA1838104.1 hypothetical protein [Corynebacterium wankanglinii]MCR5929422.1 hypothetical protein [Corynebacterium sp. zg912]
MRALDARCKEETVVPPKITDSRPTAEAMHAVEEQTASGARRIVATYAEDFLDGVTLMSMLGVAPKGFVYKRYVEDLEKQAEEEAPKKATKKATKKKATKKKATKKKSTKKATKKATKKKSTKKTAKKA